MTYVYNGTYWVWVSRGYDSNTWTALGGATSAADGTAGYAPKPTTGQQSCFLRGNATWVSAATVRSLMGLGSATTALSITYGGTGATNATNARTKLGLNSAVCSTTASVTSGSAALMTSGGVYTMIHAFLNGIKYGTAVNINSYNSSSKKYTTPSAGFVVVRGKKANISGLLALDVWVYAESQYNTAVVFAPKGSSFYIANQVEADCRFIPISY